MILSARPATIGKRVSLKEVKVITLQQLVDECDVKAVVVRYANSLDRHDWAGFRECFAPQVAVDMSSLRGGTASIMDVDDWVRRVQATAAVFDKTLHYISNQEIEMMGDEAVCCSHLCARHWKSDETNGQGNYVVVYGIYTHRVRRTLSGWRITGVALDCRKTEGSFGDR
jgi:hypothetical protein